MARQADSDSIEMESVVSSNISAVGWDQDSHTLQVEFSSGDVWQYDNVSREVYENLRDAGSVGGYFASAIKNRYTGRRV